MVKHPDTGNSELGTISFDLKRIVAGLAKSSTLKDSGPIDPQIEAALSAVAARLPNLSNGLARLAKSQQDNPLTGCMNPLLRVARKDELERGSSHLNEKAYDWFQPTEPQATRAFITLLSSGDSQTRRARGNAFLRAALQGHAVNSEASKIDASMHDLDCAPSSCEAEHSTTTSKRIDMLVQWQSNQPSVEVVVEAKFGHHLTEGQLSAYTEDDRCQTQILLVLSPKLTNHDARMILTENKNRRSKNCSEWRFATWNEFLINFSSALPAEFDDEEFRRLRRSLADVGNQWR
jgi:hypothetical protein